MYTINGHEAAVTAFSFAPAGDFFASCSADLQVNVWRTNFDKAIDLHGPGRRALQTSEGSATQGGLQVIRTAIPMALLVSRPLVIMRAFCGPSRCQRA